MQKVCLFYKSKYINTSCECKINLNSLISTASYNFLHCGFLLERIHCNKELTSFVLLPILTHFVLCMETME